MKDLPDSATSIRVNCEYAGKLLSEYTLEELTTISDSLDAAERRREAASQHQKFNAITGMEFPAPNPEFLKLKATINQLIKEKSKS